MSKNLKTWKGWLLFGGTMAVVFCLGLAVSALSERRAEVVSIFNNRKTPMKGIVAVNEEFKGEIERRSTGSLVAFETGDSVTYGHEAGVLGSNGSLCRREGGS